MVKVILHCLASNTVHTELKMAATPVEIPYEPKLKFSDHDMDKLSLSGHESVPQWDYSIKPQRARQ